MKNSNLKLLIFLLLFFGASCITVTTSYAQTSEATESASAEKKLDIKQLLTINGVKNVLGLSSEKKEAVLGEVARVTDETITLNTRKGTRIIPIDNAISITKDNKKIELTEVAVENWVTVLGKIVDDTFSPVFFYVYTESLLPKTQYVAVGTITEISKTSITIIPRSGTDEKVITVSKNTAFEDLNGVEITLNDLEEDITVLISGHENESKVDALTIRSLAPVITEN